MGFLLGQPSGSVSTPPPPPPPPAPPPMAAPPTIANAQQAGASATRKAGEAALASGTIGNEGGAQGLGNPNVAGKTLLG